MVAVYPTLRSLLTLSRTAALLPELCSQTIQVRTPLPHPPSSSPPRPSGSFAALLTEFHYSGDQAAAITSLYPVASQEIKRNMRRIDYRQA